MGRERTTMTAAAAVEATQGTETTTADPIDEIIATAAPSPMRGWLDGVDPDDERAERYAGLPDGLDLTAVERRLADLKAATNRETASIYLRSEVKRFSERFKFDGLDVEPSGVRERFVDEARGRYDDHRRAEARALRQAVDEARTMIDEAARDSQRLRGEAELADDADRTTRLLARIVDRLESNRAEAEIAALRTRQTRRRYEATADAADRHFIAAVERRLDDGRLVADDPDELAGLLNAVARRRAGRVPHALRQARQRLDAMIGEPVSFSLWLDAVAAHGFGAWQA